MKLASVVLLVTISSQEQFQNFTLQDEQNSELKVWINLKSKHTCYRHNPVDDVVDKA